MLHVIPAPRELTVLDGPGLSLGPATRVVVGREPELLPVAVFAADLLGSLAGCRVGVEHHRGGPGAVELVLAPADDADPARADDTDPARADDAATHPSADDAESHVSTGVPSSADDEAYRLTVSAQGARLVARTPVGLLRALATLRQLVDDDGTVPAVQVDDAPRYGWRGLSLDVARHFVAVGDLEQLVELLWLYKLQTLHLHLTDDQAWRLALPSRPELAQRSSGASVGGDPGGHYGPDDWRRLLEHAAARGVRIVPEIDVPGHVNAALHADGSLVPGGEPAAEYLGIDVGFSRLHDDLPATGPFLRDVFSDVAAMTPGPYVHLGGDEVLRMERPEYVRLVGEAAAAIRAAGKTVVGWQEAAHADLGPGAVVQLWDLRPDPAPVVAAARAGAGVLMSPGSRVYLDMKYEPGFPLGLDWAGHVEVRDAYDWDPATLLDGLPPESVVGVEAALWTETLRTLDDLTLMLLPRLAAVAEVGWSARRRDWPGFAARLGAHPRFWDRAGWRWHPSPQVGWGSHPAG